MPPIVPGRGEYIQQAAAAFAESHSFLDAGFLERVAIHQGNPETIHNAFQTPYLADHDPIAAFIGSITRYMEFMSLATPDNARTAASNDGRFLGSDPLINYIYRILVRLKEGDTLEDIRAHHLAFFARRMRDMAREDDYTSWQKKDQDLANSLAEPDDDWNKADAEDEEDLPPVQDVLDDRSRKDKRQRDKDDPQPATSSSNADPFLGPQFQSTLPYVEAFVRGIRPDLKVIPVWVQAVGSWVSFENANKQAGKPNSRRKPGPSAFSQTGMPDKLLQWIHNGMAPEDVRTWSQEEQTQFPEAFEAWYCSLQPEWRRASRKGELVISSLKTRVSSRKPAAEGTSDQQAIRDAFHRSGGTGLHLIMVGLTWWADCVGKGRLTAAQSRWLAAVHDINFVFGFL